MKTISKLPVLIRVFCILTLLVIFTTTFYSCSESDRSEKEYMRMQMISLMNTLRDAAIELDAEKVINLCLDTSEFLCFSGSVMNYEQFVKAERVGFANFVSHQLTWDTLIVKVLSPDVVAALAPFHQKLTLKDGTILQQKGEVTWIATRTDNGLKLIYGHAGHRLDSTTN